MVLQWVRRLYISLLAAPEIPKSGEVIKIGLIGCSNIA
jgi:hypothetical protein